ncbi:hypothetical protein QA640_30830 [Bradyrhizobium sp. CB82]|uniref:hypothetical protein n=1 Tax=Bradyrhizobium sp. CB82 TaxID=3039159 RepID=UPI0024B0DB53|nr:hypothetical protein [Bradyrhizobium sp. CB82]WFU38778.1 hypothetical protein QA640_30830 [Bradyrhizobium sp. CB82]
MQSFIAIYRPHAAREDTDLFPKLKEVVSSNEYDAMAEDFEKQEHQLFGQDGFEKMAARVAQLEQQMVIRWYPSVFSVSVSRPSHARQTGRSLRLFEAIGQV